MIEQNSDGRLRILAPMLIGNATALLAAGRVFLRPDAGQEVLVYDLSAVAETDSSALAVIFDWLRTARARGVKIRIISLPASMISQAALYGVSDYLPLA